MDSPSYEDDLHDVSLSALSIDQRLLIAQAVHSVKPLGPVDHTLDWARVVDLLQKHAADCQVDFKSPLILNPRACWSAYSDSYQKYLGDATGPPEPRPALALTRRLYQVRIKGIGDALVAEQQRFKTLVPEIEEIQRGTWDDKLEGAQRHEQSLGPHTTGALESTDVVESDGGDDDVPRSRSPTPLHPEESGIGSSEEAVLSPLGSEPSEEVPGSSETPNASAKLPATRKRKMRSDSLSSAGTDSTTVSKKKKGLASPSPPSRDLLSSERSAVRVLPLRKSPQVRTRSGKAAPAKGRRGRPITLGPLQSPDGDDRMILQQLTTAAQLPSKSENADSPELQHGSSSVHSATGSRETKGEGKSIEPPIKLEPTSYAKPHLTQEIILKHTQLEMEPHESAANSLRLSFLRRQERADDSEQKAADDALSTSHSPASVKKARVEQEAQIEDDRAGTPSSVSFPTGITEGSSTAQRTPVTFQISTSSAEPSVIKASTSSSAPPESVSFRRRMLKTHASVQSNPISAVFREPVKPYEAPGYSDIVKRPMDLRTLAKKLRDGTVKTTEEYRRDLMLMLANAVMFNHEGSEVTRHAKELLVECDRLVSIFMRGARY